ncbi:MAG: phage terminase large subunit [Janthinobacterium lividum]
MVAQKKQKLKLHIGPNACAPKFRPYLRDRSRHLLLWGGRDSTKSDFVALELLLDCMQLPYFLCVMIREKQNTIADSQIATLKKVAEREGLSRYFRFPQGPTGVLEVSCLLNKNKFIGRGTDDMDRMKSVSDPTCAWYEEANQIAKDDADVVSTTLRTSRVGAVIREIYSFNPDHKEDYKQFWIWKKFFDGTGNPHGTTFDGQLVVDIDGQLVRQSFRVLHSTAADNPWCPPERRATYKAYQFTDPYRFRVWYEGLWATKQTGNEFYPRFDRATHTGQVPYLSGLPIWQSWDANSLPYCAMFCAQIEDQRRTGGGRILRVFKEYAIGSPNSGLRNTGHAFLKDRVRHEWTESAVFLTGDASLRARKPSDERSTAFDDVLAALTGYADENNDRVPGCLNAASAARWPKRNPEVMRRRDFVNYLLAGGFDGISVQIDAAACPKLVADLELVQLGIDGKLKEMYTDPVLNVRYQKLGHMSDDFDYICCTIFEPEYVAFKARGG